MNLSIYADPALNLVRRPVMKFYEEGDWLRIEVPGHQTRYLSKKNAQELLYQIGLNAVLEKNDYVR